LVRFDGGFFNEIALDRIFPAGQLIHPDKRELKKNTTTAFFPQRNAKDSLGEIQRNLDYGHVSAKAKVNTVSATRSYLASQNPSAAVRTSLLLDFPLIQSSRWIY
jgi:hypothetical protein